MYRIEVSHLYVCCRVADGNFLSTMDVNALLIGLAIFLILALVIYLLTSFTIGERSFEDEHQRQVERDLQLFDSKHSSGLVTKKDKSKKKAKKTAVKAADTAAATTSTSSSSAAAAPTTAPAPARVARGEKSDDGSSKKKTVKMVELDIDPTVIETETDEPPVETGMHIDHCY